MRIVRYHYPRSIAPRAALLNAWPSFDQEIDRLVNTAFSGLLNQSSAESTFDHPRVDLYEDKENFFYRAELPGLKREDLQLEVGDGVLTLGGERKTTARDGETAATSRFSRTISVPARVQEDKINARYEDGVLTVTLPKAEEVKPKRVAIQVK